MAEDANTRDGVVEKLTRKYTKAPIKTDIYSLEKVKVTIDDFFIEYCKERGFREKYHLTDFQNVVGIISTIQAGIALFLSMYCQFENVKSLLAAVVYSYFAINIFSLVVSYFAGGKITFYEFEARTRIDKTPVYVALLYWKGRVVPVKHHKAVFDLFDDEGIFNHTEFLKDLEILFKE